MAARDVMLLAAPERVDQRRRKSIATIICQSKDVVNDEYIRVSSPGFQGMRLKYLSADSGGVFWCYSCTCKRLSEKKKSRAFVSVLIDHSLAKAFANGWLIVRMNPRMPKRSRIQSLGVCVLEGKYLIIIT